MVKLRENFDKSTFSLTFLIIAIVIHIIFILSLVFGFLNPLFHDSSQRLGQGSDFFAIYQAGYNILVGQNPYKVDESYKIVPYAYPYIYHPFVAFTIGLAFNIFSPFIAYWVWVSMLLALIWYSCYLTHKICKILDKPKWVEFVAIGMWLCFTPTYLDLFMGQTTLMLGLLTFFSCYAEMRKKELRGTLLWTLACLIKQIPYLLTPAILSSGRTKKVVYNIIISIIAIISFFVYFFSYFVKYVIKRSGKIYDHHGNFDFRSIIYDIGVFIKINTSLLSVIIIWVNLILLLIIFALLIIISIYSKDYLVSLALFASTYFIVFSGVWEHHYTFLLPFIIMLWIRDDSRYKWALVFVFLAIPTPFYLIELFNLWYFPFILLYRFSKFIPALIFFILLLIEAYKKPRQAKFMDSLREVRNNIYNGFKKQNSEEFSNVFIEKF